MQITAELSSNSNLTRVQSWTTLVQRALTASNRDFNYITKYRNILVYLWSLTVAIFATFNDSITTLLCICHLNTRLTLLHVNTATDILPQWFIIIIDNRGLNTRWCPTPMLLSLPTTAYLGQRGLTPAGLPHTTAQCHLTILGEAVLFCLNHPSFRTPESLSYD